MNEYLAQLRGTQSLLAEHDEFEVCAEISDLINAIETKNVKKFIQLCFDVPTMKKVGFFKKGSTYEEMAERVRYHFSYENVFEYAIREGLWCKYERYANGIYDIKRKVIF